MIETVYVPGVEELKLQVELAVPPCERTRLLGLQIVLSPADGEVETESKTVPAKLLRLAAWTTTELVWPVVKLVEELLEEIEKSGARALLTLTVPVDVPVFAAESVTVNETE
jgi:hypothetical protein